MFKKKCSRCEKKVGKDYDFCPYCGTNLESKNKEDYGFLGKDDFIDENPFELFESSFMDKLFDNAIKLAEKMVEKQIEMASETNNRVSENPKNNLEVQFFVNGKKVFPEDNSSRVEVVEKKPKKITQISKENAEKLAKLPRKEPTSKVRRISGKLIYELGVPGVKNIEDVLINRLENSIEIKALGKDKVYSKTLNINLPILGYKLEKDNLILELKG